MLYDSLATEKEIEDVFVNFQYTLAGKQSGFGNLSINQEKKHLGWHTFYPLAYISQLQRDNDGNKQHDLPIGSLAFYKTVNTLLVSKHVDSKYVFNNVIIGNFSNDFIKFHNQIGLNLVGESVESTLNKTGEFLNNKGFNL